VSGRTDRKIALIGGGGVRTPLLIFGINEAAEALGCREIVLFDPDEKRQHIMAELGQAIVAREGGELRVRPTSSIEAAVEGADFVLNSVRVGGIAARASDELAAIKHGYPGQETTGPAGAAMALRTVPVAIEQARLVKQLSPDGWIINFTNPAGLITQAILSHTNARAVGICDTPTELFHRIAQALGAPADDVRCEYVGLNHLGWVRRVYLRGEDVTYRVLNDDAVLGQLYSASLFDFDMIRTLGLIPTEYLFFYYSRRRALQNQQAQGSSRGAEVERMNAALIDTLAARLTAGDRDGAIAAYVAYLNRRSGSYMKLEAAAGSALDPRESYDGEPFRVASGYHRIALDVMTALTGARPARIVVNTRNAGAVPDLPIQDVVEIACRVGKDSIRPEPVASMPDAVLGLVQSVKAYERAAIEAALSGSPLAARKALLIHPAIGEWEPTAALLHDLLHPLCIHC
jgi:6-phospho-beta-glucosidase